MHGTRPVDIWLTYSARRNVALAEALAATVEHAALARALAAEALAVGDAALAETLNAEAEDGERLAAGLLRMLDELGIDRDDQAK